MFSLYVINSKNPVHSVLSLICVFLCSSCLLLCLDAEFLAFSFIIIYVGAIAILFLFVVMMIDIKKTSELNFGFGYRLLKLSVLIYFLFALIWPFFSYLSFSSMVSCDLNYINWFYLIDNLSNMEMLGQLIFLKYPILVLIAGYILFISVIGSLMLVVSLKKPGIKRQISFKQLSRKKKNAFIVSK